MFTSLYSWCTSLAQRIREGGINHDFAVYYREYFEGTPVCNRIFWIALAVSIVAALLYYLVICNFFVRLSKRWSWFVSLLIVFVVTLCITGPTIVGRDNNNHELSSGIFFSSYQTQQHLLDGTDDPDARAEIMQIANDYREQFLKKEGMPVMRETLPLQMSLANGTYAIVVFFILSVILKRFTTHGSSIPF